MTPSVLIVLQLLVPSMLGQETSVKPIVFVCEHGSVKSMIAAQWFNRMAAERGVALRAVSRGVEPDARIPEAVAQKLSKDGFDLTELVPVRLQQSDLTNARHVVSIGAKSALFDKMSKGLERWDDIPPASSNYAASRDALRARIAALLDTLARPSAK